MLTNREGWAYSAQSDIAVTADLTTEGRENEKKDMGKGKEESSIHNPYNLARSLLNKERSGKLETPLEEVEKYLHVTHSDPNREDALGDCDRIEPVKAPEKQLDVSEP